VLANQWYPPESGWGGVAMYNRAIANAYREVGHEVTVIARRNDDQTPADAKIDGIRIKRLLTRDRYYLRRMPLAGYYSRACQQLFYSWRIRHALAQLHQAHPIDIVEFAEINAEGFFFARAPWVPFVVRCHTPTFVLSDFFKADELPFDTKLISACEQQTIRRAHALTAPSSDMAQRIAEATGVARDQIAVIPNPLAVAASNGNGLKSKAKKGISPTILYVGRIERAKGIGVLAAAIPEVLGRVPQAHFVVAGYDRPTSRGTSQQRELEEAFACAGVSANVEFAGAVEQSKLPALYEGADLCVVPALQYESFSYTCAQAMAAGKPVVATRIGGMSETLGNGLAGVLVDPDDPSQLAQAIVDLLHDNEKRNVMGQAGREKAARDFEPAAVAQRNLEVYERARQVFAERRA